MNVTDNTLKAILILGLIIAGIYSLFLSMENIASAIFGGLIGYLSKDIPQAVYNKMNNKTEDDFDEEA